MEASANAIGKTQQNLSSKKESFRPHDSKRKNRNSWKNQVKAPSKD